MHHTFIHSFIQQSSSLTRSLIHSFIIISGVQFHRCIQLVVHPESVICWFIHSSLDSFIHSFFDSFGLVCSFSHLFIPSLFLFSHSFVQAFIHSFISLVYLMSNLSSVVRWFSHLFIRSLRYSSVILSSIHLFSHSVVCVFDHPTLHSFFQ